MKTVCGITFCFIPTTGFLQIEYEHDLWKTILVVIFRIDSYCLIIDTVIISITIVIIIIVINVINFIIFIIL